MRIGRIVRLLTVAVMAAASAGSFAVPAAYAQVDDTEWPGSPPFVNAEVDGSGSVTLIWGRSTDNVGVVDYRVLRNGVELLRTGDARRTVFLDDLPAGDSYLQLQGIDAAGNESRRSTPTRVTVGQQAAPSAPFVATAFFDSERDLQDGLGGSISFVPRDYSSSISYRVFVDGIEVAPLPSPIEINRVSGWRNVRLPLAEGVRYIQIVAVNEAGVSSVKSAPYRLAVDKIPPPAPFDVVAEVAEPTTEPTTVVGIRDVNVTFDIASTDGVQGCVLLRNLGPTKWATRALRPDGTGRFTADDQAPSPSVSYYQVYCIDFAGNRSARSVPFRLEIN